ncbi:hypothetical protein DFP72DRAFT_1180645 [Ephemerocybe angulata]|uniref:Uncharacterized protein n=1 Tax=Ephemerocybe angulata TaxID=980116 RepID=A0A8H6H8D9_9AGAR|nr:hypothetical protein DFP72DRAFT_1180645 [Tulosesus angulatus]
MPRRLTPDSYPQERIPLITLEPQKVIAKKIKFREPATTFMVVQLIAHDDEHHVPSPVLNVLPRPLLPRPSPHALSRAIPARIASLHPSRCNPQARRAKSGGMHDSTPANRRADTTGKTHLAADRTVLKRPSVGSTSRIEVPSVQGEAEIARTSVGAPPALRTETNRTRRSGLTRKELELYSGKLFCLGPAFQASNGYSEPSKGGTTIAERDDRQSSATHNQAGGPNNGNGPPTPGVNLMGAAWGRSQRTFSP